MSAAPPPLAIISTPKTSSPGSPTSANVRGTSSHKEPNGSLTNKKEPSTASSTTKTRATSLGNSSLSKKPTVGVIDKRGKTILSSASTPSKTTSVKDVPSPSSHLGVAGLAGAPMIKSHSEEAPSAVTRDATSSMGAASGSDSGAAISAHKRGTSLGSTPSNTAVRSNIATSASQNRPATAPNKAGKKPGVSAKTARGRPVKSAPARPAKKSAGAGASTSTQGSPPRSPGEARTGSSSANAGSKTGTHVTLVMLGSPSSSTGASAIAKLRPTPSNSCCATLQRHLMNEFCGEIQQIRTENESLAEQVMVLQGALNSVREEKANLEHRVKELLLTVETLAAAKRRLDEDLKVAQRAHLTGNEAMDALQKKLAEEHKANAQLVFFNRSLKTQICELEEAKEELANELALVRSELTVSQRPKSAIPGTGATDKSQLSYG